MLIINQKKTTIINLENVISIDCLENGGIKAYYTFGLNEDYTGEYIGIYHSQDRAKEIIDEIVQAYNSANGYGFVQNIVYQMPEK